MASGEIKSFPEWARILYRGVRGAIASAIAQVVIGVCGQVFTSQGDVMACLPSIFERFKSPEALFQFAAIAFISGFTISLGMWLRDMADKWFGWNEKSLIQRVMPI